MKKKILVVLLMLTYIFTSVCTPFVASANSLEVVISSSKVNIDRNMKVQISGKVSTTKVQEITVRVMDPNGNIDYANSTYSNSKGEFIIAYTMRTNLVGKYTVTLGGVGIKKPETCYFEFGKNPRLYSLTPSSGTLEPQFSEEKENYTMKVDARTSQLLWTATAIEKVESIKINDVVVKSGEQSRAVPLKEGENTFKLEVKALSGVTKKYTVKVIKYKQIPADVTATASVNKSDMVSITGNISSGSGQQISITVFDPKENISYVNHTLSDNEGEFAFTYINQKQVEGEYKVIIGGDGVAKPYKTSFVYGIDLRLKELSISSGVIEEGFNPAVSEYRALVDKKLKQVYLNLKTYDERVNILVNNHPYSANNPIVLNSGNNEVTIKITGVNGAATKTYRLNVNSLDVETTAKNVEAKVNDAQLVTISGNISPVYGQEVSVVVKDPNEVIDYINSTKVSEGSNGAFSFSYVLVNKKKGEYKVSIGALGMNSTVDTSFIYGDGNADLEGFLVDGGTSYAPEFKPEQKSYFVDVSEDTKNITIEPIRKFKGQVVKVNGTIVENSITVPVDNGRNSIYMDVTSKDGEYERHHIISVYRSLPISNNADLDSLNLVGAMINESFEGTNMNYTSEVGYSVDKVFVNPIAANAYATITVNGNKLVNGSEEVYLKVGSNFVVIKVTAENGETKTYTIVITRGAAPILSNNTNLSGLTMEGAVLNEAFAAGKLNYTANVASTVNSITVRPVVADAKATVKVNGKALTNGGVAINLMVGDNTIPIEVTAENGTTKTYIVKVTRAMLSYTIGGEEHYYVFVQYKIGDNKSWEAAKASAEAMSYLGKKGYLATITSVEENNLVKSKLMGQGWLGGTDATSYTGDVNGKWYWATGPEAGRKFATQNTSGSGISSTEVGMYQNFISGVEPNDRGNGYSYVPGSENCLHINPDGSWNDYANNNMSIQGYVVEFGASTNILSDKLDLSSLSIDGAVLNESFASGILNYTAKVANTVSSIMVKPVVADVKATVKVDGKALVNGGVTVNLAVGDNNISVEVTAENGTTKTYTIKVNREAPPVLSNNSNLSSLTIDGAVLNETFAAGTLNYTASVVNTVASIIVKPVVADTKATVKVDGKALVNGGVTVNLVVGDNTILIEVTAENGTTQTYTIKVNRAAPVLSNNSNLSSLTMDGAMLNETFATGILNYTASVANTVASVIVKPVVADAKATVKVNGKTLTNGGVVVNLMVGDNTIPIEVTAENGTTKTYIVKVTRAMLSFTIGGEEHYYVFVQYKIGDNKSWEAAKASAEAMSYLGKKGYLATITSVEENNLVKSKLMGQGWLGGTDATSYTGDVNGKWYWATGPEAGRKFATQNTSGSGISSTEVGMYQNFISGVEPNDRGNGFSYVPGSENCLHINPDGSWNDYANNNMSIQGYVVEFGASTNILSDKSDLSSLSIEGAVLNETFTAGTLNYTVNVANTVASIIVKPVVADTKATVKVDGRALVNGGVTVNLAVGDNTIPIEVTAENGTTKTYTIKVNRAVPVLSNNTNLSSLTMDGAVLNESFASGSLNYTAKVTNTVSSIIVKPVVADTKATVKVDGKALVNGGVTVNLAVGDNTISIEVTAENGTTKTYTIKVNRDVPPVLSNNSNLSSLTLDGVVLNETFAAGTLNYTASVTNTVASITVKPVVADAKATVKVDGKALVNGGVTVNLAVGDNTISVEVTAEDGTIKTYSIRVTRTMLSFTVGTKEHYYVFVQYKAGDNKTWSAAKAYAEAMTYQGKKGYLVTITSAQENNFVKATLKGQGWLGGTDDTSYTGDVNGKWYWATGPEAGKKFATQNSSGSGISSTEVGMYQNFVSGVEPNDRGNGYSYVPGSENCLHINPDGSWNDYANNNISIQGYVVEFGD